MLEVYSLNVFLVASETENFSDAARQLNLTQPAVSMQIRTLEKRLGVSLFHRAGRSLSLTEEGKALIPMARDMVNRSVRIEEEIESLKGECIGHLKFGCSTTTGKYILPHLAARFRRRYPKVQITIYNHSRDTVLAEMCEGIVHLGVMSFAPTSKEMEYRPFFTDYVVLIVSADHPWAKRDRIAIEELIDTNFIMRDDQSGTRQEVQMFLQEKGFSIDDLRVVMEIGNAEAISMAVEEGIGAAFVSRAVARRGIGLGKIKEVRVDGLSLKREVYIAYNHRHPITQGQSAFLSFIDEPENKMLLKATA